jgi:hypothetical protein
MKKSYIGFSIGVTVCILIIIALVSGFWEHFFYPKTQEQPRTKIITPGETGFSPDSGTTGQTAREENLNTKVAMEDGETVIAVLNQEQGREVLGEQIVAYRRQDEIENQLYIAYIKYDEKSREYKRLWNAPTAASRVETVSLFIQDLIGDRNDCLIVTGMNNHNEHTMTVFRLGQGQAFSRIADLRIEGSIIIQETARSLAYQQGITKGQSFAIVAYGHDASSENILDQLESTYVFNPVSEQYELSKITKIPGSQIEQRRLRELLSGVPGVFENFINDLWYYVSPQGTLDSRQYLYFNHAGKEIIFFGDESQQVFQWQNSTRTRYGLYISSQNISISTLRRFIDIELESLDSIRLRVFEDVRLKITVSATWDGSYRRAGTAKPAIQQQPIKPAIAAVYDSSWGRLHFHSSGEYTLHSGGTAKKGHYVFFKVGEYDLLELRPENEDPVKNRTVYRVEAAGNTALSLSRVRLGAAVIQDMLEGQVTLTLVSSE